MLEKIKIYINNLKNYLLENKKVAYTIIGVVAIIIAAIFILIGIMSDKHEKKETDEGKETTAVILKPTESDKVNSLEPLENSSEIVSIINKYYAAKASADINAFSACVDNMEGISENTISNYGKYIEAYQDIVCYEITENADICSGVIFVTFKYKYTGIETPAPGYSYMQVIKNAEGNYKVHNMLTKYEMNKLERFINSFSPESPIKILEKEIDEQFKNAYESDEDLQKLYDLIA